MMNRKALTRAAAVALAVSAVALAADTMTVSVDHVDLRGQKSAMFPVVATAHKGDTLTVLQAGDPWTQVQIGETVGWVRKSDLGGSSMNSFLSSANASANGSTAAGNLSAGNAGKGLNDDALAYSSATGQDPAKLDKLVALRKKLINDGTLAKFDKQGNVGIR